MTKISDVFSFSVQNADYWTDLLSGGNYPAELTEEETRALEAARGHIETIVVELLHAAGSKLAEQLGEAKVEKPRFKSASTAKNRLVTIPAPTGLSGQLYRIEFGLDKGEDDSTIVLYASLVVKKGAIENLRRSLSANSVKYGVDNYYIYAPGIALTEGTSVDALADEAANLAETLLKGFSSPVASASTEAPAPA